ncbi:magnesium/cobalt transporter CorA [candidate division KSB1 bacterium]|nr:magnesium/cobalt transporter CorA [candidate division KSB1 bacterium]
MARFLKKRLKNKGEIPGTPVFVGEQKLEKCRIRIIDYDPKNLEETELPSIGPATKYLDTDTVSWINIDGLHDMDVINEVGEMFRLHPLTLEDITNTDQRPKMVEYDEYIYIVLKMLFYDDKNEEIVAEQLSMIIGPNYILTFQERIGDIFDPVRQRIRKQKGRVRTLGSDYLAYILLDTIVDNYFYLIESLGEKIEDLEVELIEENSAEKLNSLNFYKRELSYIRKSVFPVKDTITHLLRLDSELIGDDVRHFLKDLEDLTTQVNDALEVYRELLTDLLNIYHTNIGSKLNEIIKVLTIFSVIFIPLTFFAGIYGTNFEYLPELHFRYSYFIFWGALLVIALGMLFYFKRKKWI